MKKLPKLLLLFLLIPLATSTCGPDDLSDQNFELNFSPRDLPTGTAFIRYYVLNVHTHAGGTLDCDNFFVNDPRESVSDYPNDRVDFGTESVSATDTAAITIKNLEEGPYVFYVEALDINHSTISCGCGEGTIVKGSKTDIPIRLVDDC
jgi:hypothetical protein